jgi:hypothetical protein
MSRILNQQDYYIDLNKQHAKTSREFYNPKKEHVSPQYNKMMQLSAVHSSRHSRAHSNSVMSDSHKDRSLDERRMKINDLNNIKYIKYRVDPYLKSVSTPLKKYKKRSSIDNRYDFLSFGLNRDHFNFK